MAAVAPAIDATDSCSAARRPYASLNLPSASVMIFRRFPGQKLSKIVTAAGRCAERADDEPADGPHEERRAEDHEGLEEARVRVSRRKEEA
jgi:hypothetical protein